MAHKPSTPRDASKPRPDKTPSKAATGPTKPLLGCGKDLLRIDPKIDLTEPAEADWEALR